MKRTIAAWLKASALQMSRGEAGNPSPFRFSRKARRRFAMCSLLLALCATSAHAACLPSRWESDLGAPDHSRIFTGTLGKQRVRMLLHVDEKTGQWDGAYGYADQPGTLALTGSMLSGEPGAGMVLEEHDSSGRVTAHFSLLFFYPIPSWMTASGYKKGFSNTCDSLIGSWQAASGGKAFYVALRGGPDVSPSAKHDMASNDATAYQLKQAMLHDDRKAFVSLLHYPFCTSYGAIKAWFTPAEVLKHYHQIASMFEPDQWTRAIPHFRYVDFVNGSVVFYQGKVAMMCVGQCPVVPIASCSGFAAPEQKRQSGHP